MCASIYPPIRCLDGSEQVPDRWAGGVVAVVAAGHLGHHVGGPCEQGGGERESGGAVPAGDVADRGEGRHVPLVGVSGSRVRVWLLYLLISSAAAVAASAVCCRSGVIPARGIWLVSPASRAMIWRSLLGGAG